MGERFILEVLEYLRLIVLVVVLTTLLNTLVFTFSTVQQSSMEHTLHSDDILVIEKVTYLAGRPGRGDIVVFVEDVAVASNYLTKLRVLYEDTLAKVTRSAVHQRLVKRVIGIPGDEIIIEGGRVYVNGDLLEEAYTEDITLERTTEYPLIVESGQYFVMGDNRDVSRDSRHFGTVPAENIEGRAVFRLFPFQAFGWVE